MVKIEHFGSRCIVLIALTKHFAKRGMIKKRAIMLGPIFDPTLQIINFLILNMCNNLNQRKTLLLIDK
jgi:hypothetical protein